MSLVTTRTRAQLKEEVGRILDLLGDGDDSLSAEHDSTISDRVDEILMELSRDSLIMFDVTDSNAIDIASFRSIAVITAASLVYTFPGLDELKIRRLIAAEKTARADLKRMVFDGVNDDPVEVDYF